VLALVPNMRVLVIQGAFNRHTGVVTARKGAEVQVRSDQRPTDKIRTEPSHLLAIGLPATQLVIDQAVRILDGPHKGQNGVVVRPRGNTQVRVALDASDILVHLGAEKLGAVVE
jgi:hypothetical protein